MLTQFKSSRQKIFFKFPDVVDTKYMGLLKVLTKSCLIWDVGMCGWRGGILWSRISVGITCVTLFQIIYPAAMTTASNAALWGDFYNMWTESLWGAWEQDTGGVCYNIMGRGKHSFMEQRDAGNSSQQVLVSSGEEKMLSFRFSKSLFWKVWRGNFKVKKFELSLKLEMIICELKVNFDCLFMFLKLHWKSDKSSWRLTGRIVNLSEWRGLKLPSKLTRKTVNSSSSVTL